MANNGFACDAIEASGARWSSAPLREVAPTSGTRAREAIVSIFLSAAVFHGPAAPWPGVGGSC